MRVTVFCKILRGPGFFHFFALPWGMALVLLTWDSYFRKQMEGRTNKGVEYQAAFKKISQKLPYAPHWPELKHSVAAGVAGKCNLYSGTSFWPKSWVLLQWKWESMYIRAPSAVLAVGALQWVWLVKVMSEQDARPTFQRGCIYFFRNGQSDRPGCPVVVGWSRSSPWSNRPECQCTPYYPATRWVSICSGSPMGRVSGSPWKTSGTHERMWEWTAHSGVWTFSPSSQAGG